MKKLLVLTCALGIAQPALAGNINLSNLTGGQAAFRNVSEDLGSALSYKGVVPAESLGVTGFDFGLEVTQTNLAKSATLWKNLSGNDISNLYVPKLHVTKGLPLNIDIGAFYSAVPTTDIKLYGGELRWAFIEGGVAMPAVAVRGAMTKLSGVNQLALDTKSVDLSISKGFAMLTPYAGVGQVWVNSTPDAATTFKAESFKQNKVFAGANLNFGLTNLAVEFDKTGSAQSTSLKLGFRF
ncbi:MAG: hypothetical protein AB1722_11775 [Pseudomonadota bacterium]